MFSIISSQFNYLYGDQIHFPYSIGRLIAYVKTNKNINPQFTFDRTFIFRDQLNNYAEQSYDSDILLCSCYVWNWEVTKQLAKKVLTYYTSQKKSKLMTNYGYLGLSRYDYKINCEKYLNLILNYLKNEY